MKFVTGSIRLLIVLLSNCPFILGRHFRLLLICFVLKVLFLILSLLILVLMMILNWQEMASHLLILSVIFVLIRWLKESVILFLLLERIQVFRIRSLILMEIL